MYYKSCIFVTLETYTVMDSLFCPENVKVTVENRNEDFNISICN